VKKIRRPHSEYIFNRKDYYRHKFNPVKDGEEPVGKSVEGFKYDDYYIYANQGNNKHIEYGANQAAFAAGLNYVKNLSFTIHLFKF